MIHHSLNHAKSLIQLSEELISQPTQTDESTIVLDNGGIKASALLSRQALEGLIESLWDHKETPKMKDANMRSQLLCLRELLDPEQAKKIRATWEQLSCGIHQKTFETKLARTEVQSCINNIKELAVVIQAEITFES